MGKAKAEQAIEFRRKSDGFRCTMKPSDREGITDGDDYEPYADYVAAQLAPAAETVAAELEQPAVAPKEV